MINFKKCFYLELFNAFASHGKLVVLDSQEVRLSIILLKKLHILENIL